jgi:hypothetical protein
MVERRMELRRRYHRKGKMRKLKSRLAQAKTDGDRSKFLTKIKMLSPFWTPADAASADAPAKAEKPEKPDKPDKPKRAPKKS